jgi:hypothetical protein
MSSRTVLIASQNEAQVELLVRECAAMMLRPVVAQDAAEVIALFQRLRPDLLIVDPSLELRADWPLHHEIALNRQMRTVPMILLMETTTASAYAFPPDHCVYRVKTGPRMLEAVRVIAEELIPTDSSNAVPCCGRAHRSKAC